MGGSLKKGYKNTVLFVDLDAKPMDCENPDIKQKKFYGQFDSTQ
jgi:hypothetical protein